MVYLRSLSCSDAVAPHRFPRHEIQQLLVSRVTGQMASGSPTSYRIKPARTSNCGKVDTNSERKVLKSSPWARHFQRSHPSDLAISSGVTSSA